MEMHYSIVESMFRDNDLLGVDFSTKTYDIMYKSRKDARKRLENRAKAIEDIYTDTSYGAKDFIKFVKSVRLVDEPDHKVIMVRDINNSDHSQVMAIVIRVQQNREY